RGSVFRRHIRNRCTIGERQTRSSLAVVFDKLAYDLCFSEHLGDCQHQIGRGHSLTQSAFQVNSDDIGGKKVNRLTQHSCFGFDTADAPPDHPQTIDHRGVRISAYERIRIINSVLHLHTFREVLEIDLVAYADARGNNLKAIERLHPPLEKLVTSAVPLELHLHVQAQRPRNAGEIDLN